jgi:hypothetical protein
VEELHSVFKEMRDKHIAHAVNPFEQVEVGLALSPEDSPNRSVEGVAHLSMTQVNLSPEWVTEFGKLATLLRRLVWDRAELLQRQVLESSRNLKVDDLYKRPRLRVTAPGRESTGKARM